MKRSGCHLILQLYDVLEKLAIVLVTFGFGYIDLVSGERETVYYWFDRLFYHWDWNHDHSEYGHGHQRDQKN